MKQELAAEEKMYYIL